VNRLVSTLKLAEDRHHDEQYTARQLSIQKLIQDSKGLTFSDLLDLCDTPGPELRRDLRFLHSRGSILQRTRLRDGRDIWVTGVEIISHPALS
jgi:hypothetical protein